MNKKPIIIAGLAVATAFSVLFVAANNKSFAFGPMAEGEIPTTLTLTQADSAAAGLPNEGGATYDPIYYEKNNYTTLKYVKASLHDTMFVRLNKLASSSSDPSYVEKVQPSYGVTSFTMVLNYGTAAVYIGYEEGLYTKKYTFNNSNKEKSWTINTDGNYFRIQNENTDHNALIRTFSINYGCTPTSKETDSYNMTNGNKATTIANPGKWYYFKNGSCAVGPSRYENGTINSSITAMDMASDGVYYRYQPETTDDLTNWYNVSFEIRLNVTGDSILRIGGAYVSVTAGEWVSCSNNGTIKTDDSFLFKIHKVEIPESGSITVEIRNIVISRKPAATE